jgi:hypothetical protein
METCESCASASRRCLQMQKAGVTNHIVIALDDYTEQQAVKWGSPALHMQLSGDEEQKALNTGSSHAVSGAQASAMRRRAALSSLAFRA